MNKLRFHITQMQFSPELSSEIQARIDRALDSHPAALSDDRNALLVNGGIGYDCFVSADGDIFIETHDVALVADWCRNH